MDVRLPAGDRQHCCLVWCPQMPTVIVVIPAHMSVVDDVPIAAFVCVDHEIELLMLMGNAGYTETL